MLTDGKDTGDDREGLVLIHTYIYILGRFIVWGSNGVFPITGGILKHDILPSFCFCLYANAYSFECIFKVACEMILFWFNIRFAVFRVEENEIKNVQSQTSSLLC